MERGPLALFGAIVAVGLGPALWLGAQFGRLDTTPARSPASVDQRQAGTTQLMGGGGAGETDDTNTAVRTTPRAHILPLTTSSKPTRSATRTVPSTSASPSGKPSTAGPSTGPSPSPSNSTAPSNGNTEPPPSPAPSPSESSGSGGPGA